MKEYLKSLIPKGRDNAISRSDLCSLMQTSDRVVRSMIEELRNDGELIISRTNGKGYFYPLPHEISDVEAFEKSMNSRAISCFASSKAARNWIKEVAQKGVGLDL